MTNASTLVDERPTGNESAVLVALDIGQTLSDEAREEFAQLVLAAGVDIAATLGGARQVPDARLFIGSGKAEELKTTVKEQGADVVIFNHELTPAQQRNLERLLDTRVVDRTGLILDIFAQRARSFEGKLQVELAQLKHLATRLVRGWTHLERQKGGIGLRGPGESQLETDRRLLGVRVAMLEKRLAKIERQRAQGRQARTRAEIPVVSCVGYTNAGKSTLFNTLTGAGVLQADQLFATLDPTLRAVLLADGRKIILADTVGFVSQLPHELVAAFRSTLEETRTADLLLHVIDAASPQRRRLIDDVEQVLGEINAGEIPTLQVFNKLDLLEDIAPHIERDAFGRPKRVWISAATRDGIALLLEAIAELTRPAQYDCLVRLGPQEGKIHAWLFRHGMIENEAFARQGGWRLRVTLSQADHGRLLEQHPELHRRVRILGKCGEKTNVLH